MKNESGLIFTDISSERIREYHFPNGNSIKVKNPLYLNVSASGGHRIYSEDGYSYYVNPKEGWFIRWKVKKNMPNFVK